MPSVSPKKNKVERTPAPDVPAQNGGNLTFKVLLILLAGLFIYAPAFNGGWLWDDDQEITANPVLADSAGLVKIWSGDAGADYFPLKSSVQWLYFQAFGVNQTAWHLLNVVLHLVNALLIWKLLSRLGIREAWLGGLLFCIHPILVESVAWVSELKNTLSLPFLILSMLAWINFDERKRTGAETSNLVLYFVAALLLFVAAGLCKTSVVMYPVVILLYCWWKRQKLELEDILFSIPFFLISAGLAWATIHFQFGRAIGTETIPVAKIITETGQFSLNGLLSRVATAGMAIVFYFYKCVLPIGLLPIYPRWEVDPPSWWQFIPWPVIAGAFVWMWTQRKTWGRHALFGIGFFVINLFPVLGFITMSYMRITWVADHFLYLPLIGLIGLATAAAGYLYQKADPEPKRWFFGVGVALFVVLVGQSHRYAGAFANEYEMWTHTLKSNPNAWQAHSRLGKVMLERGENDAAFYHIEQSVTLRPDLAETHNNYGAMLEKKGDLIGALEQLRWARRIAPDIAIYRINLGSLLVRMGKYDDGAAEYRLLLEGDPANKIDARPDDPTFLCNYGVAMYFLGKNDEAITSFERALKINPNLKDAKENLAAALKKRDGGRAPATQPQPAPPGNSLLNSGSPVKLFGN